MADCLAGIERGDFSPSPAAELGAKAGCPFCTARCSEPPKPGAQVVILNGFRAGSVSYLQSEAVLSDVILRGVLPLAPLPRWLAPFDLRHSFILDEIAVWFCNQGIVGDSFFWERSNILMMAAVCWDWRIAVTGAEIARLLLAHGLPAERQAAAADAFEFALAAMITAKGRRGFKNRRNPDLIRGQWAEAMRLWGR